MRTVAGRRFRPAGLALMLAALVQAASLLPTSLQGRIEGPVAVACGALALASSTAFFVGWFRDDRRTFLFGLHASVVLWLWIAILGYVWVGPVSGTLALAWVVLAAGSSWYEQAEEG